MVPPAVSLWDAESVNGGSPHVWFPPWSMNDEMWWCFAGDTACYLFRIQGTLNQHGYHTILLRYAIPSDLRRVGLSFIFQQDNDPKHTSRLCKGYLTKKESDGVLHQMTWPPQWPNLNPIEMVWDELDLKVKEKQPPSAQHMWELQDCWKSIPGEAGWENAKCVQSCHQRVATLKNLKYILICVTLFWLLYDSICVIS